MMTLKFKKEKKVTVFFLLQKAQQQYISKEKTQDTHKEELPL